MEKKIFLSEKDMPKAWYNIQADLPSPLAAASQSGNRRTDHAGYAWGHLPDESHRAGSEYRALDRYS